ncbi:TATA box-binding protein-associated factor RNA polymerase I subunit B [Brevipalpus obovatus]|uniref:TATA box-binding protein-associated factor RNA polymerase I subunit B n=1 Tax=Brevipalpus obovatus TaxID=246614 RepID=UPI003D9ED326
MDACTVCGAIEFEEIDALFYCSICQSQKIGSTIQMTEREEIGFGGGGLVAVRLERKKKVDNTGVPWTTTEAFNLILINQCKELTDKLGLGPDFRQILLGLWATYLCECEIAFKCGQKGPKLHLTSHSRDIQLIKHKLPQVLRRTHKKQDPSPWAATGDLRVKRSFDWMEIGAQQFDYESEIDFDSDVDGEQNPLDDQENVENLDINSSAALNIVEYQMGDISELGSTASKSDLIARGKDLELMDSENQKPLPITQGRDAKTLLKNRLESLLGRKISYPPRTKIGDGTLRSVSKQVRKALEKLDELTSDEAENDSGSDNEQITTTLTENPEDSPLNQLENLDSDSYLSKRSRVIKNVAGEENIKDLLKRSSDISIERMTMNKTVALIIIALRIMNLNYFVCDLLHWIKLGHVTYFNPYIFLPRDWLILPGEDSVILHPTELPCAKGLELNVAQLTKFLGISLLPNPNLNSLLQRFLVDLNLPMSFERQITDSLDKFSIDFLSGRFVVDSNTKQLPCYESLAFALLVVFMKKIFFLDKSYEAIVRKHIKEKHENAFVWTDWINHTARVWKAAQRFYLPINKTLQNECNDAGVISSYYDQATNDWLGIDNISAKRKARTSAKEFSDHLLKSMECLQIPSEDSVSIKIPTISQYPFKDARDFTCHRFKTLGLDGSALELNFADKSTEYIKHICFEEAGSCELIRPPRSDWSQAWKTWEDPMPLLLEIGSFILNRSLEHVASKIFIVERKISSRLSIK